MTTNDKLLTDALEYISFASNGCPVVINGKDVPMKWQAEIRKNLRHLGKCAEEALKRYKESTDVG